MSTNTAPNKDAGLPPEGADSSQTVRSKIDYHMQVILDHVWGPTGSVIIHIILIICLVKFMVMPARVDKAEIEVTVMEPNVKDLEKLEQKLEEIKDIEVQVETPDNQVNVETPEETVQNAPVAEDLAALDIKTDAMSPLIMKGLFAGRSKSGRAGLMGKYNRRFAGPTDKAILSALRWLKDHQLPDGSWIGTGGAANKVAMTGIALMAFLAHGETHQSEEFGLTVKKAIEYLVSCQQSGGAFNGDSYANGIAEYAISEAYALTRIPSLRANMENGALFVVAGMQDTGGYTYGYAKNGRRDTSVAGWQAQALKAAYIAGAEVPGLKDALKKVADGMRMNYQPASQRFIYATDYSGLTWAVTAIGTLSLQLLGYPSDEKVEKALESLEPILCSWDAPGVGEWPMYSWYYLSQCKFHSKKASHFERWNNSYAPEMIKHQNTDGSWTPPAEREVAYGPVYGTAFTALTLQVYYRFLPTFQEIKAEEAPTENQSDDIVVDIG